ncbi:PASTA domain-containing protein [Bifidobacterium sp. ESL0690]|uniref:PASTA domain-containing protein n=1 Tax=Bifidobacterium sp. ESL0690 TaxID=2983214 RepID=UPI0023F8BEE8|nr:PASTA domain-containing protein [Bifidobacterium sp. ESL0690]WEV46700.1 PASTA domain-containing protein [Bifidobacterium sp. ESL0690]
MKFCNKCGHKLDDDQKFCTKCGAPAPSVPLPQGESQSNPPTPTSAGTVPTPANTVSTPAGPVATTAVKANATKRLIIIIAAIVAVALVAVGAGFGTYKAQLWGGKTVPNPADLGIAKSSKTHEFTAADVEASLHKRGFKTTIKQTFSAKPKGSFVGYHNIQANKRYSTGNPITVFASNGPGVPQGTRGQSVRKIQKSIASMGVPVHYYKIVVTDQKTPADTVIASHPADGQAVSDTKTGINIGVAEQGKGVGYDVVGQDKGQAQQQYASAGFNVTLKPRFSSKARIGKIVDSDPKPGSEANGGNLTLYYGIDASGFKDAVSSKNVFANDKSSQSFSSDDLVGAAAPVEGKYCNESGKCIDLTNGTDTTGNEQPRIFSSEAPETPRSANGTYDFHHQLVFCGSMQQAFCSPETDPYALYTKNSGAFELTPYDSAFGFTCGNDLMLDGTGFCIGGKHVYLDQAGQPGVSSDNLSGARYEMGPLYTYFPVGANVQKVTDSGYFDKDEVAKSAKQKAVDTSRPFFISRDKTLYDKTSLDFTSLETRNPFEPFGSVGKKPMEPVKPAPSDETAYYLVEDPQLDWGSLPEYVIGGDNSGKSTAKGDDNGKATQPAAKDATPDQILTALAKGDFTPIAGSYCLNSGECMQLSKEGVLTGVNKQYDMIAHEGSHLSLSNGSNGSPDTTYSPDKPFFILKGPDSEYTCDGGVGLDQCSNVMMNQMTTTPTKLLYVFKGADTSAWYKENDQSIKNPGFLYVEGADDPTQAPTDKPYITIMNSHSTTSTEPPHPNDVYYLKE